MSAPLSMYSLQTYKRAEILVYAADGTTFLDKWRFVQAPQGWSEAINSAIQPLTLTFSFGPRTFDSADLGGQGGPGTIAQGNVVRIYAVGPGLGTGTLVYQGVIYRYALQMTETGQETITVLIVPQSSVLSTNGITESIVFGTPGQRDSYVDPIAMFNYFFSTNSPYWSHPYTYPLTLDPTNPTTSGASVQYTFQQQDILSILTVSTQLMPTNNWFWRANPDLTTTLNQTPTTPQHQFIIGRHCKNVQNTLDWTNLYNVIQVIGASNESVTLTSGLTGGTPTSSLSVSPLTVPVASGQTITINDTMATCTLTASAAQGDTTIRVSALPIALLPGQNLTVDGTSQQITLTAAAASGSTTLSCQPLTNPIPAPATLDIATTQETITVSVDAPVGATTLTVATFTPASSHVVGTQVFIPIMAVATGSDIATFGPRVHTISDPRIVDLATAQALANGVLALLDQVSYRGQVEVVDYRGSTDLLGYDTESIKVGQSAQVLNPTGVNQQPTRWDEFLWDNADWDYAPGAASEQIVQIVKIDRKWTSVVLYLSSFQPSQDRSFAQIAAQLQLFTTGF